MTREPNLLTRFRDWWRGYSDADVTSVIEKAGRVTRTGEWCGVTDGEMKAIQRGALRKSSAQIKAGCDPGSVAEV